MSIYWAATVFCARGAAGTKHAAGKRPVFRNLSKWSQRINTHHYSVVLNARKANVRHRKSRSTPLRNAQLFLGQDMKQRGGSEHSELLEQGSVLHTNPAREAVTEPMRVGREPRSLIIRDENCKDRRQEWGQHQAGKPDTPLTKRSTSPWPTRWRKRAASHELSSNLLTHAVTCENTQTYVHAHKNKWINQCNENVFLNTKGQWNRRQERCCL